MIIVKLIGGLGNQMFQYAIGRHLSIINNSQLKVDLSFFKNEQFAEAITLRNFGLDCFNLELEELSEDEKRELYPVSRKRLFKNYILRRRHHYIEEKNFYYDPSILKKYNGDVTLSGYWQSEKYFKSISRIIRQDFIFKHSLADKNSQLAKLINETNSVCVHFRRGDYIYNPLANQILGVLDIEHYRKALTFINERIENPFYVLFSDDLEWLKGQEVSFHSNCVVVNERNDAATDLHLMSMCKHFIIANSSFSWWASWLGHYSEKIVIFPNRWFRDSSIETKQLMYNNCINID